MTTGKLGPDALLDLAIEMLKTEIGLVLPPEKRYASAMIVNALEIAQRAITGEDETADFALLDAIYDDGDGTMKRLATDIRDGQVDTKNHPDLLQMLKAQLISELAVRNPRSLESRGGK